MKPAVEYHVYASFPCNSKGVRVAITLSEKSAQRIGGEMSEWADDVWYCIRPRRPGTKPWRRGKHKTTRIYRDLGRSGDQLRFDCDECDDGVKRDLDPITGLYFHPPQTVCTNQKLPGDK